MTELQLAFNMLFTGMLAISKHEAADFVKAMLGDGTEFGLDNRAGQEAMKTITDLMTQHIMREALSEMTDKVMELHDQTVALS